MTLKNKVIISVVVVTTAFAAGRYTTPVKTKVEIQTVTVEKETNKKKTDTEDHTKTTVTETRKPDGTVTKITTTENSIDTKSQVTDTTNVSQTMDQKKEVTRSSQLVTVSFMSGVSLTSGFGSAPLVYGGYITKPVMGPITIGVWGLSNMTFGASVGLQF